MLFDNSNNSGSFRRMAHFFRVAHSNESVIAQRATADPPHSGAGSSAFVALRSRLPPACRVVALAKTDSPSVSELNRRPACCSASRVERASRPFTVASVVGWASRTPSASNCRAGGPPAVVWCKSAHLALSSSEVGTAGSAVRISIMSPAGIPLLPPPNRFFHSDNMRALYNYRNSMSSEV
jgi:hypothetical protein